MDARVLVSADWLVRRIAAGLLLVGCLALAGCGTLNHMQCQISPPAPEPLSQTPPPPITDADREAVREILQAKASELRLVDRTDRSLVPQTLAYYIALDTDYPMKLIAWEHDSRIVVDFMHAPDVVGETLQFREAREQLFNELQERFPDRSKMVPIREQVTAGEKYAR